MKKRYFFSPLMLATGAVALTSAMSVAVTAVESGAPAAMVQTAATESVGAFADHVVLAEPAIGEPVDLNEWPQGVGGMRYILDFPGFEFTMSKGFDAPIVLRDAAGNALSEIVAGAYPTDGFVPFAQINPTMTGLDNELGAQVDIYFFPEGLSEPGKYSVEIPDGFFLVEGEPVGGSVIEYVIAGEAEEAPAFRDLIIEATPAPSYSGETVPTDGMGLAAINFELDAELLIDRDCKNDIILLNESTGQEAGRISPATDPDLWQPPFINVMGYEGKTYITITIDWMPIVAPGSYSLNFPEGLFKTVDGVYLEATAVPYEIGDGGNTGEIGEFADHIVFSYPSCSEPFNVEDSNGGMAQVMINLDLPLATFAINSMENENGCIEPVRLFASNGKILAEAYAGRYPEDEFIPYVVAEGFMQNEDELCSMACFAFSAEAMMDPGKYLVEIPDGFFLSDGEPVGGSLLTFHMLSDGSMGSFKNLVVEAVPDPSQEIDLSADGFNYNLDALTFEVDGMDGFSVNPACSENIVITKDGLDFAEIKASASAWGGKVNYAEVFSLQGWDDADDEFGGNASGEDDFGLDANITINPYTVNLVLLANPITEPGTYKLSIPDNFFVGGYGDYGVEGSEFEYIVVDISSSVDMFKADSSVTVYSLGGVRILDNAPVESLCGLEKGCYVINGKKVILK